MVISVICRVVYVVAGCPFPRNLTKPSDYCRLLCYKNVSNSNVSIPLFHTLLKDHRIVCDTYAGLLGSVFKRGQYSETMTQLAKFSRPTAANGRHYRGHAASGPTLGRLNYYQINTVTSCRRQKHVVLVGNTSASVADVAATSRRRHCATELTRCTTYRRCTAVIAQPDSHRVGGQN